jgi:hypothetical protein
VTECSPLSHSVMNAFRCSNALLSFQGISPSLRPASEPNCHPCRRSKVSPMSPVGTPYEPVE